MLAATDVWAGYAVDELLEVLSYHKSGDGGLSDFRPKTEGSSTLHFPEVSVVVWDERGLTIR